MEGQIKEDRPSYVKFERRPVEDRNASIKAGYEVFKDVDYALVTPVGSKDVIPRIVSEWFVQLRQQVKEGRMPESWLKQYEEAYKYWQNGQEPPLNGTPIKGWSLLSPAMQQNVIGANILTVEDLAQANDEACRRMGMGAIGLKDKAANWLKASTGPGKLAAEMSAVQIKNRALEAQVAEMNDSMKQLKAELDLLKNADKEKAA